MNFDLIGLVPNNLRKTLLCFAHINSPVEKSAADIITCHSNGYLYELKKKKIIASLNIHGEKASSVSCYYLTENEDLVTFYLILTSSNKLMIVRKYNRTLKVDKIYEKVKKFEVFDFECLGYPQIMIHFLHKCESVIEFPVKQLKKTYDDYSDMDSEENNKALNSIYSSLEEKLQIVHRHINELTEEFGNLQKICGSSKNSDSVQNDSGIVPFGWIKFSSCLNEQPERKVTLITKWTKVFGRNLILGMRICNTGKVTIQDLEMVINHKDLEEYTYRFLPVSGRILEDLFSSVKVESSLNPGEEIFIVGALPIPFFVHESQISITCYLICSNIHGHLLKETFSLSVIDIALQHSNLLQEHFNGEDWMSISTVKQKTSLSVTVEGVEDDEMESLFQKLGFKRIKHVKDKLFYCTSNYLNEVFVAFRKIGANPEVWEFSLYTNDEPQIYFLVNALYDLLPDTTVVLKGNVTAEEI